MEAQQSLPLKRVTIFKNGTALVTKEGKAVLKDGAARLPIPAEVLFGGYWVGATKDNSIKSLIFQNDKLEKDEPIKDLWQHLAGNIGKQVTLSLSQKEKNTITGKILSFEKESMVVKIKQDNGKITMLATLGIYQIDFNEEGSSTYKEDSVRRMVLIHPEKSAAEISLQELYIQAGMNWIPSYLFSLKDDKTARLEMKATIENSVDDIKDAEAELVVGAPQMYFGQRRDPITYDYMTVDVNNARSDYGGQVQAQMLSNARVSESMADAVPGGFNSEFSTEGEKSGDLYIYKIGKISIPKNGKGSYPVFATTVEYRDKYEGTIEDKTNFVYSRHCDPTETNYDVYHSLELKNKASVPFTTAPVMVVSQKEQFLAQDLLKYTPVGGSVDIRLSKAIDIVMRNAEEEKQRIDQAKEIARVTYGRVVIKGTVSISNFQSKEVTVVVKKNLNGAVISQSDGAKVVKGSSRVDQNPTSIITWEVKLAANGKKVLTYEYEVFFAQ
ncbi:MAG: hypothetical protein ACKVOQ_15140 [Cyclobacteriaceae bacterium]